MQGSKSEFFQKSAKKDRRWDDGTGGKNGHKKRDFNKQARHNNQKNRNFE